MIDTGCAVDRGFDQVGNTGINDLWRTAGQYRGDRYHRKLDRWIAINTDILVADDTKQHQHGREHIGEHMSPDGNFR